MRYDIQDVFTDKTAQAKGLMFREDYPEDSCALFEYPKAEHLTFHGRNCNFPIIVCFINDDGTIDSHGIVEPNSKPVSSKHRVSRVIELKATPQNQVAVQQAVHVRFSKSCVQLM